MTNLSQACLLTPAQMAQADRLAINSGITGQQLMETAGEAVAQAAARMEAQGAIGVLCGPGDNGGDGYVAARILRSQGRNVDLFAFAPPKSRSLAASAAARWSGPIRPLESFDPQNFSLTIDALFGAGLSRDLGPDAARWVHRLNAAREKTKILSVDIPTGIDGANGQIRGAAVEAHETLTFFRPKPGHFLLPGRMCRGRLQVVDIGIEHYVLEAISPKCFKNGPELWGAALHPPQSFENKFSRGHALVLSGGPTSTGAARLAARAALRAGAGLVTLASPAQALLVNGAHLTAIMLTRCDSPRELADILQDRRLNAVVLGPALGVDERAAELVATALTPCPARGIVLDADIFTAFAPVRDQLFAAIQNFGGPVVMTPHGGEFARLFSSGPQALCGDKLADARAAASLSGATIVYKGADTVIASPDGRAAINDNAPPWLATAGSGDVLAGMIGGILAQNVPAFEAAASAVWLHGAAAQAYGRGLIAEDLPEILPKVLQSLRGASGE